MAKRIFGRPLLVVGAVIGAGVLLPACTESSGNLDSGSLDAPPSDMRTTDALPPLDLGRSESGGNLDMGAPLDIGISDSSGNLSIDLSTPTPDSGEADGGTSD